ncbi:MAG: tRNA (adenosine(37)-N6)-threonylcarbamoyltransferase complex transferase subunit TsaD, partial [Anaerotignaceae bacterium]
MVIMEENINILAIESSCDETAAAVVKNGRYVLSNVISSQIELHKLYGGVVPEIASRKHVENIDGVIKKALADAGVTFEEIDAIGVTYGPGLVGALLVGLAEAKALAFALNKPLVGVHHIEGHICANYIEDVNFKPPYVALVVSGGHSHLLHVKDYGVYEILGRTRDDAAGEAYDKVARAIGMGYPGGPKIDKAAKNGNPKAINFPKVYLEGDTLDFSFSGLKSAVLNYLNKQKMMDLEIVVEDVAASFQQAVVEVLVNKTITAAKRVGVSQVAMAGGVASNSTLRNLMAEECSKNGFTLNIPSPILC